MEIIGESAHRVLAYIEAMHRQGCPLTATEVDAYAKSWCPTKTITGYSAFLLSREASAAMDSDTIVEKMTDYLLRLGWAVRGPKDRVTPTRLGLAVLREANSPRPGSDVDSTLEVIMDPGNPFAYAQLMSKIASFEDCFIVDPYLDQDQLLTLATFPTVTRILTGNKHSKAKVPAFGVVLKAAPHLEVRMVEQGTLHDRIAMPAVGSAMMLGSSLNSIARRFGVATSLEDRSSRLIRDNYNIIWDKATVIEPVGMEPPLTVATSDVVEKGAEALATGG